MIFVIILVNIYLLFGGTHLLCLVVRFHNKTNSAGINLENRFTAYKQSERFFWVAVCPFLVYWWIYTHHSKFPSEYSNILPKRYICDGEVAAKHWSLETDSELSWSEAGPDCLSQSHWLTVLLLTYCVSVCCWAWTEDEWGFLLTFQSVKHISVSMNR